MSWCATSSPVSPRRTGGRVKGSRRCRDPAAVPFPPPDPAAIFRATAIAGANGPTALSTHSLATGVPGEITAPETPNSPCWTTASQPGIPMTGFARLHGPNPTAQPHGTHGLLTRQRETSVTDTPYPGTCTMLLPAAPSHPRWCHNAPQPYGTLRCQNGVLSRCCAESCSQAHPCDGELVPRAMLCPRGWATAFATVHRGQPCHHRSCMPGTCTWHQHTATPGQGRPAHSALPVLPQALRAQKSFEFKCPHHHPTTTSRSRCWYR